MKESIQGKMEGDKVVKYLGKDILNLPNKSMAKALYNKYNKNKFDIKIDKKYWWIIGDCTDRQFGYVIKYLYKNYGLSYAGVSSGR